MRSVLDGHEADVGLNNQNVTELTFQHQIGQQQQLYPTIHPRHDSLLSCSSLHIPLHSVSHHQVEAQPYANVHRNLHSPNGYPQLQVNNGMSRSTSQYSSTSSGQGSHLHSLQRESRGSFDSNMVRIGSEMSRSISSTSASQHTAPPQPYRLQSTSQGGYFQTQQPSNLSPDMAFGQFPTTAMSSFDYAINDSIADNRPEYEDRQRTFVQIAYGNE
ncbi:hypothetical protein G6011_08174 [Alternaria panax]|uniref:Uncharacterized protein n=1 Tax=Alternaria panax TaxID=48097 RepID=A0AAD4FI75_9PLEO|nr:hypothetical protein G6011_08174 [Alternaria panax]